MDFTRELNRLLGGVLLAFFIIAGAATYWSIIGQESILLRDDNPRAFEEEAAIRRGSIYDSHNSLLAQSFSNEAGIIERKYTDPSTSSVLGYFSLRYGVGGAESAYDRILRGDHQEQTLARYFEQGILHRPQIGTDIRLTIDLPIQQSTAHALQGYRGASVVIRATDGAVISLVSAPTFDPNTLDSEWEQLRNADGEPFFNRAIQGNYQPGGTFQTPLMAVALLTQYPIEEPRYDAEPIVLNDLILTCATNPPDKLLTLTEAYQYACPSAFAAFSDDTNNPTLEAILANFHQIANPVLPSFAVEPREIAEATDAPDDLKAKILGQGSNTISPLGMATFMTTILNDGNATPPYLLDAIREPDGLWVQAAQYEQSIPVITAITAQGIHDLMVENALEGGDPSSRATIGKHTSLSYAGDETQAWFVGFITPAESTESFIVVVVVEDTADVNIPGVIAKSILNSISSSSSSQN